MILHDFMFQLKVIEYSEAWRISLMSKLCFHVLTNLIKGN